MLGEAIRNQKLLGAVFLSLWGVAAGATIRAAELPRAAEDNMKLTFAGMNWNGKGGDEFGPGPNAWSADHAWVDEQGKLHLKIAKDAAGKWRCAEVTSDKSFGYGEYRFTFSGKLAHLDSNIVLGLFTYLDDAHEIDFELSRWGRPAEPKDAQFVVQPATNGRIYRFAASDVPRLTCSLLWTAGHVQWRCWEGAGGSGARQVAAWAFDGAGIPVPSAEKVHMNLWLVQGKPPKNESPAEVVIESFAFRSAAQ